MLAPHQLVTYYIWFGLRVRHRALVHVYIFLLLIVLLRHGGVGRVVAAFLGGTACASTIWLCYASSLVGRVFAAQQVGVQNGSLSLVVACGITASDMLRLLLGCPSVCIAEVRVFLAACFGRRVCRRDLGHVTRVVWLVVLLAPRLRGSCCCSICGVHCVCHRDMRHVTLVVCLVVRLRHRLGTHYAIISLGHRGWRRDWGHVTLAV